ncbi:MAG: Holliday junction branch migration DNA helicase RuvB [Bacilli bacterium]
MERVLSNNVIKSDEVDTNLRPQLLCEYIGQKDLKDNLKVFIEAAKLREESLDHVLLYGPPGLGKTTLATIISNEMGTNIKYASGPTIEKSGDLAAIFSNLEAGDILFIDEIHRLPNVIEEILYPAMEDFCLDIVISSRDGSSRAIRIDLPPFTLVAATTRAGNIGSPLRDRFGIVSKLEYYSEEELTNIVMRTSEVLGYGISLDAANEMAKRGRGTPRIVNRLFRRVRDFSMVNKLDNINFEICHESLDKLNVDNLGLDRTDHEFLSAVIERFNGGPVGLESVAASIGEEATTLEDVYEPYLLQIGMIKRTPRGRVITKKAYNHLGLKYEGDKR